MPTRPGPRSGFFFDGGGADVDIGPSDCQKTSLKADVTEQRGCVQGVKTPEGELPEGQEKLAWAMRVQSTRIFKLFQKFENTHSVAKRLFRHAVGPMWASAPAGAQPS